jgi:hypothetical protein
MNQNVSPGRLLFAGLLWTVLWIVGVGLYGWHRLVSEPHHDTMLCYRMKAEAQAEPRCAQPSPELSETLCRFKDAGCETPVDPPDVAIVAAAALLPPALIWMLVLVRRRRQSRT